MSRVHIQHQLLLKGRGRKKWNKHSSNDGSIQNIKILYNPWCISQIMMECIRHSERFAPSLLVGPPSLRLPRHPFCAKDDHNNSTNGCQVLSSLQPTKNTSSPNFHCIQADGQLTNNYKHLKVTLTSGKIDRNVLLHAVHTSQETY